MLVYYLDEKKMFILQPNFMMSFFAKKAYFQDQALNQLAVVLEQQGWETAKCR